jgi:Domain of unknown function (DUF4365)
VASRTRTSPVPRRPGMREPESHRVEQWAVDEVARIVRQELGWIYTEPHGREYGVDAFAEVRDCGSDPIITGEMLGLQIKGGESWFSRPTRNGLGWTFRESDDHLAYWLGHSTPVIVIIVRADKSAAYWQVISPQTVKETGDSFTTVVPASQLFDGGAREQLAAIAARPKVAQEFEKNLACLPPAAGRYLAAAASADRLGGARLADRLATGRHHPLTTTESITEHPPAWMAGSPAAADLWIAVGRYASEHGGSRPGYELAAASAFVLAAEASSGTRSARARALAGIVLASTDPAAARTYLEQARADGQVLLADAGLATLSGEDPDRTAAILTSLRNTPSAELDQEPVTLAVLGCAAVRTGDPAAAVSYHSQALEAASQYHDATSPRLAVADALRRRALTNPDHSAVDFDQAASHARSALRARRAWDGPSAEALAVLLDVLLARGDVRGAIDAAVPASLGGTAQDRESADPAVAMRAASAAQAVGDMAAYNYFLAAVPRAGASRRILKAAASSPRPASTARQVATWSSLLAEALGAHDDHQAVLCITALARLGQWPSQADELVSRTLPPDAASTIRAVAQARACLNPGAVNDLRDLAAGNVIAALELLLFIEDTDGADAAIAECERQSHRRMHAQLTIRHVDLLGKSGRDAEAARLAEQIIPNPAYPLDIRQKLCAWHAGRAAAAGNHAEAARIARIGLSAGPDDTIAWVLIGSLFLEGRTRAAREALVRLHPEPDTEGHARLWTDLHRGVRASPADARATAAVAARQPAGSCCTALARMLRREITLAAKAGQPWPADLTGQVGALADPGEPQPSTQPPHEREAARRKAITDVQAGRAPQAAIASAVGLPYSYVLLARMAGFQPSADLSPALRLAGQDAARTALHLGKCAADLSAFHIMALLPEADRAEIRARIPDLAAVPASGLDITMTRDNLRTVAAAPAAGASATDAEIDEQMDLADRLERAIDQADRLPPGPPDQSPAFQTIAAARQTSLPLWCDDNALRQRARAAGVAAFSVVDLLTALLQHNASAGPTADEYREPAWRALASQYVTDLPLAAATIIAIAGDWEPGPAHTAIARPGWWHHHASSWAAEWLQIAAAAAASDTPGALTQITRAALTGALQAVSPGRRTQRYQQLGATTLAACHDAGRSAPPDLLAAMADHAGQAIAACPEHVLGELITQLRGRSDIADPVGTATALLPNVTPT